MRKSAGILLIALSLLIASGMGLPLWGNSYEAAAAGEVATNRININTASREELMRLKGIGPAYADRIIEYREEHGPFQQAEDIMKVKGIGLEMWEANKDIITVE
jgi:competence protein ComEA